MSKNLLSSQAWKHLRAWYVINGRHDLPWRKSISPWGILMAECLLQRTRAKTVSEMFPRLLSTFASPRDVVLYQARWLKMTEGLGLNWRIRSFIETCKVIIERFDGEVPDRIEDLMELPGVGHYIASAVKSFAFGHLITIVDANTIRLSARIAGVDIDHYPHRNKKTRQLVAKLGDAGAPPSARDNYGLLDVAAELCRPSNPRCDQCPLRDSCATGSRRAPGQR